MNKNKEDKDKDEQYGECKEFFEDESSPQPVDRPWESKIQEN